MNLYFIENIEPVDDSKPKAINNYTSSSIEELQTKLQEALIEEAYEKAAKIRDEISKRKTS
jgi:protein-arginine kinase activator protein McsA